MNCRKCQSLAQSLQGVLSDFFVFLESLSDTDRVVRSVSKREEGGCCRLVELCLQVFVLVETMQFDWAWVLLLLVEFLSQELRKHLVNSKICQEGIILFEKRPFILELLEVALQLVKADDFGDARDFQVLDLIFEGSCRVLDNDADA